ncbi:serine hydrolase domain-containing protein [Lichenifustis flavocetrariae]|uniref:Beta-lactamase family protein n=1 Tax=Lichenifustis flavocetrariae TaxID=2949735 RepID=A0AA42CMK8_9HYPH|nr:serine hydrolase [Lichenifustis flavocetrariae]MCW6508492.1 beta-lactamase family protein [Lichenifustis flavocetrariae]
MFKSSRRDIVLQIGAVLMTGAISAVPEAAAKPNTAAAAGFRSDPVPRFNVLQASGRLDGVHGVVAMLGGDVVFERYFPGQDWAWGRDLGHVAFGPDTLHDLRSVTKSIVGLLYGIALADKRVPPIDDAILDHFPEYVDLRMDRNRSRITIRHALTMTLGMKWDESLPYTDPANSEIAMERATDRYRFILDRPILGQPGRGWIYSGGAVALIGKLIEKGTGQSLPDFAEKALFAPLGISGMEWARGSDGEASAASGLRLAPRSVARIGRMILSGGMWDNRSVLPKPWLDQSFQPAALVDIGWPGMHYGHLWYLGEALIHGTTGSYGEPFVAAFGNGGQRLFVFPSLDFVLSITTGNYDSPEQWRAPAAILSDVFLPSLTNE